MINRNETPIDKIFNEIISDTSVAKAYKLGSANMAKFVVDVLKRMEFRGIKKVDTNDLIKVINEAVLEDKEIYAYFKRL